MLGDQVNDPTEIAMPNGLTEAAGVEIARLARPQLQMPNIATVFKAEITRLARKEVRENSDGLRKALATQRTEIASFKRRIQELEGLVKKLAKGQGSASRSRVERVGRTKRYRPSLSGEGHGSQQKAARPIRCRLRPTSGRDRTVRLRLGIRQGEAEG